MVVANFRPGRPLKVIIKPCEHEKKVKQEAQNFWKGCQMKDIILLNANKKFCEIRLVNEALGQSYSCQGDNRLSEPPRPSLQTAVCIKPGW